MNDRPSSTFMPKKNRIDDTPNLLLLISIFVSSLFPNFLKKKKYGWSEALSRVAALLYTSFGLVFLLPQNANVLKDLCTEEAFEKG